MAGSRIAHQPTLGNIHHRHIPARIRSEETGPAEIRRAQLDPSRTNLLTSAAVLERQVEPDQRMREPKRPRVGCVRPGVLRVVGIDAQLVPAIERRMLQGVATDFAVYPFASDRRHRLPGWLTALAWHRQTASGASHPIVHAANSVRGAFGPLGSAATYSG